MALSIKTDEADQLARELAKLKGETMTQAITVALRERLARERITARHDALQESLRQWLDRIGPEFDRRPVTKEEWDEASGDTD